MLMARYSVSAADLQTVDFLIITDWWKHTAAACHIVLLSSHSECVICGRIPKGCCCDLECRGNKQSQQTSPPRNFIGQMIIFSLLWGNFHRNVSCFTHNWLCTIHTSSWSLWSMVVPQGLIIDLLQVFEHVGGCITGLATYFYWDLFFEMVSYSLHKLCKLFSQRERER